MKGPRTSDAALEEIIPQAVQGDARALNLLMNHWWLYQLLNRIADWAWNRYKVDQGRFKVDDCENDNGKDDDDCKDIQDVVANAIRHKITTLENRRNTSWRAVLRSWCYTVAKRHCLSVISRDWPLADGYRDSVIHDNTPFKRGGKGIVAPCSTMLSEEEEREQEAQEALHESQISKIDETIWKVFNSFTPEEARIASLWARENKTLKQIAIETHSCTATTQRRLIKLQKTFVEEIGKLIEELGKTKGKEVEAAQILGDLMARRAKGLRELIASSLQEMVRFGPALRATV